MATSPLSPSPETLAPTPERSHPETPQSISQDPSSLPLPSSTPPPAAAAPSSPSPSPAPAAAPAESPNPSPIPTSTPTIPNPTPTPNPTPNPTLVAPPPPSILSFTPSFRPLGAPQYSTYTNPYSMAPNSGIKPPGVSAPGYNMIPPGASSGVSMAQMRPHYMYPGVPGQIPASAPMAYGQVPNGYMTMPGAPQQPMHPTGIARYPAPYPIMLRPGFPPRPMPPVGVISQLPRPPVSGVRAFVPPVVRPIVSIVAPPEKPHTTVYVGKIAPTIDNEFLLSLLRLCGPVKSWKRAQDPSDGTPKGFGFCEFESAEGILRAMRLLSKLNLDGQELVLNINLATRQYLGRYVEKKIEREKLKGAEAQVTENESAPGVENQEPPRPVLEDAKKDSEVSGNAENNEDAQEFGIVTDEERDADRDALEKITSMIEERLKTKPLPPPPLVKTPVDGSAKSNSDIPSKSRDGDSDVDIMKSDATEDKNDDETTSENKLPSDNGRRKMRSPDRSRRHDMRERDWERVYESRREKDRLDRSERDREKERDRRERNKKDEFEARSRRYREQLITWEVHEREREHWRQKERDIEKENNKKRRREILKDEQESFADDDVRKRRRSSAYDEEKRRKRLREKEDDLADGFKEEEEIAEAKKRAIEEQLPKDGLKIPVVNDIDMPIVEESRLSVEGRENATEDVPESVSVSDNNAGNGSTDEQFMGLAAVSDIKHNSIALTRKLGFGLIGSGKRTTVPSVFHEEDDEDVDDKKMRPLVPIDYSTEELQAVQSSVSAPSTNLAAAAEFAKRISGVNSKEEKTETGRERSGRSSDRSSLRDRDRNDDDHARARNENKEKMHDKGYGRDDKPKTETKKLLDAKQLIDMIPKTKEELFTYEINWSIFDKHGLDERMRPWISKKITEFLGEEEPTLVDYIVSSTKGHVEATKMLELLQSILDDEAEMFVLKMWRMLIFEIKKVETGLSAKSRG